MGPVLWDFFKACFRVKEREIRASCTVQCGGWERYFFHELRYILDYNTLALFCRSSLSTWELTRTALATRAAWLPPLLSRSSHPWGSSWDSMERMKVASKSILASYITSPYIPWLNGWRCITFPSFPFFTILALPGFALLYFTFCLSCS